MSVANEALVTRTVIDPAAIARLGVRMTEKFEQYERDRVLAELKWARNARQFLGIYDPEIERQLDRQRSRAYPKITRVKCVSMLSRMMNLLFPANDKCWTIAPSVVPNLEEEVLQPLLDRLSAAAAQEGRAVTDEEIEVAIRAVATQRAEALEREIEDQLQELGGSYGEDFVALCRKVLMSGIQYGMGILNGPFVEEQQQRTWRTDPVTGRLMAVAVTAYRPRFEFVPIWDYYPDMSAKTLKQAEGQFRRYVMTRHQVTRLKNRPDFLPDQIDLFLRQNPSGNYKRRPFETELRNMGVQQNSSASESNKYEAVSWEGYVRGRDLADAGVQVPPDKLDSDLRANVWIMGGIVVKAELDPWSELDSGENVSMYHHFIFEEDESSVCGNGLPNIMRDSQMGICALTRIALDNASLTRVFEVNNALLRTDQDVTTVVQDKMFYRDDESMQTVQYPAVREIVFDTHIAEIKTLLDVFLNFADQETFITPATGGDVQKGPSEPLRTAAGASMLRGDAALPFKDIVRNFDMFIMSVLNSIIVFNKNFNQKAGISGDFQPIARGATSLIAQEVLGIQLDNLAMTLTPEEKKYVKMRELVRARIRVRDLIAEDLVVDDATADQIDAAEAQQQQAQQDLVKRTAEAHIREILATTLNKIAQAGKNSANAEAVTVNAVLNALEKGLDANELVAQAARAGTEGTNLSAAARSGTAGNEAVSANTQGEAESGMGAGYAGGAAVPATGSPAGGFAVGPIQ